MVRRTSVVNRICCPRCRGFLYPLTTGEIQVDFCTKCSGVWLDRGELERLYGSWGVVDIEGVAGDPDPDARPRTEQDNLSCPVCPETLVRLNVRGAALDGCPGCGGVWVDHGELGPALDSFGKKGDPDMIRELALAITARRNQK